MTQVPKNNFSAIQLLIFGIIFILIWEGTFPSTAEEIQCVKRAATELCSL
jgi:hypothetical protein